MNAQTVKGQVGDKEISFETGRMAKQAHGSVIIQVGGTVVLAAAVAAREPKPGIDFFPLTVDYRERTYAAGKIPGGYFKREGRPSEHEILTSRLIDRPIRPLFPKDFRNETQVMLTVLSVDGENPSDIPAINAASAALMVSDIPFARAIGGIRVGYVDGKFVANPTLLEQEESQLDLVLVASKEKAMMIEAGSNELTEEQFLEAIKFGHNEIKKIIALQEELQKKAGKKKREVKKVEIPAEMVKKARAITDKGFDSIFGIESKEEREEATRQMYKKILEQFDTKAADFNELQLKQLFDELEMEKLRHLALDQNKRPDGRGDRDIRKITCEVGVLPRTHGSALFTRGQTQALCVATLGTGDDEQRYDSLEGQQTKSFMLHYNFPSFSVGETGRNSGPGRREIGHGALAERSLKAVLPDAESFPYTIRIVSDILESNGSSSMASVCGGTLSLMDAGVPIKAPVAGIALGLITDGKKWKVLTDIAGIEDHHGDMDFKVAGTKKGITAVQMDLKIDGISEEILKEAFTQAKEGRFKILEKITGALEAPRPELSEYAPRIVTLRINPSKIGELIGPGGKNIRKIVEETGAKIDIEDDGRVFVAAVDREAGEAAIARVKQITEEPEIGRVYEGRVQKLMAFGAFIEVLPGKDGLCHVSEITEGFAKSPADFLHVGDIVPIKVLSVDEMGKVSLSIKQAKPGGMPELGPEVERDAIDPGRGAGGGGRGGGDRSRSGSRPRR